MSDISYNIDVSYVNNKYYFIGSDELGNFSGTKQQFKFKTNSLIKFNLNLPEDISFVISKFNNVLIIEGKNGDILDLSNDSYIFYKFAPTLNDLSGVIEIFSSNITNREELINNLDIKKNITNNQNIISDLQTFNTQKRRFLGNFNYIISDNRNLVTDSSGILDDLIIQSLGSDIDIVTDSSNKIHFWTTETIVEEDLVIKGKLKMDYNNADFRNSDVSFNNISVNGINVYNKFIEIDNSINNVGLQKGFDASFGNVDISGVVNLSGINVYNKFIELDNSINNVNLRQGFDASLGNVDISGLLNLNGINVYNKFIELDNSINNVNLREGFDASLGNVDISGLLNLNGINVYSKFIELDNSINNVNLRQGFDVSLGNVDISGLLNLNGINVYNKFLELDNSINNVNLQQGFDTSLGNVDISGVLNLNGINVYNKFIELDNSINNVNLQQGLDISLGNVDIGGILNLSGNLIVTGDISATKFYGDGSELTGIGSGVNLTNYSDASLGNVDIDGLLKINNSFFTDDTRNTTRLDGLLSITNSNLPNLTSTSTSNARYNTFFGKNIASNIGAGSEGNTAFGYKALSSVNNNCGNNVAIGRESLRDLSSVSYDFGNDNIAIGSYSMRNGDSIRNNIALGSYALTSSTGFSNKNIAIGTRALKNGTSLNNTIMIGHEGAQNITNGDFIGIGNSIASHADPGISYFIAIGNSAFRSATNASYSIAIGTSIATGCTSNISNNILIGYNVMQDTNSNTNSYNVLIGNSSCRFMKARTDKCTILGSNIMSQNVYVSGSHESFESVIIGYNACNSSHSKNSILIGCNVASTNNQPYYFDECIFIGKSIIKNGPTTNEIIIGSNPPFPNNVTNSGNGDNTVTIGNSLITDNYFNGNITTTGDISATKFHGDGSELTGIGSGANLTNYSDASLGNVDIDGLLKIKDYYFTDDTRNTTRLEGLLSITNSNLPNLTSSGNGNTRYNTFFGKNVASNIDMGSERNTAFGYNSLKENTSGYENTAFGSFSLEDNTTSFKNTAFGCYTMANNITGRENSALGCNALKGNQTGSYNIALGTGALTNGQSPSNIIAIGRNACMNSISQYGNIAIGNNTIAHTDSANAYANIAIGDGAMNRATGSSNIAIGNNCLKQNYNASLSAIIAIGFDIMFNNTTTNTSARSVLIGRRCLYNFKHKTTDDIILGNNACANLADDYEMIENVIIGDNAAINNYASRSIIIGAHSGYSGNDIIRSTNSIYIGSYAQTNGNYSNETIIGYNTNGNGSNTVTIGNSAITDNYFNGNITTTGDISGTKFYGDGSNLTGVGSGDVTLTQLQSGNLDISLNNFTLIGNATKGSGSLKLNCENNSHGITIKGPPHSAGANYTLTLPNNDGDADQVLKTDGSGNLSWVNQSSGSSSSGSGSSPDMWVLDGPTGLTTIQNGNNLMSFFTNTHISGVTASSGVVTITTAGWYSLTFQCDAYNTDSTISQFEAMILYEINGNTPTTTSSRWTTKSIDKGGSDTLLHVGKSLNLIKYLNVNTKIQAGINVNTSSGITRLTGNQQGQAQFSGFKIA